MSDYKKINGISYKLNTIKTNEDAIDYFKGFYSELFDGLNDLDDWYYDLFYDGQNNLNGWQPYNDTHGNWGWVHFLNDRYPDDYEIEFYIQYDKIQKLAVELGKILLNSDQFSELIMKNLQIFSIQYYNGSDNPFEL